MSEHHVFRLRINAHSPATMPLDQLLSYLEPLTHLLGTDRVHLVDVEEGSTIPALVVDDEEAAVRQLKAVRTGTADTKAMAARDRLNEQLARHGADAFLENNDGGEVLYFPGSEGEPKAASLRGIEEEGYYDGIVVNIGGSGQRVPVRVEPFDGRAVSGFRTSRDLAKMLASRLFEPTRLFGMGTWSRGPDGWRLERFDVKHFEPLKEEVLSDVLRDVREAELSLQEDALQRLLSERSDETA